ncbi:endo-1,4-beta-xylanase [Bosea sp. PAMC 26642]|uniref:endo-1,4-beta-xylanase n=1 Tax=Bosea sp. (strain PAMC 26642) TaxID=1792307 RepID=UPI00077009E1|nr:endo-1,4-beta-xylanase [Bosea sp. PAMC 26642]AMJ62341.1 hypothetical protein AXW83_20370 [Bosea sp. PAMC 26642]
MMTRRQALAAAAGLSVAGIGACPAMAARAPIAFGSAAEIGVFRDDPRYREALKTHCDIVVPMNDLKWEALRHERASFDFSGADELVAFAASNKQALRGHTLLWGEALPPWAKTLSTRAEAERELIGHIEVVVDRYKGKIATWDVVNEAIRFDPREGGPFRDTIWQRLLGPEHIEIAFRTAARIDPKARLVLNDFSFEEADGGTAERRKVALSILRRLKDKGIPVHGLGMQAHLYGDKTIDSPGIQQFMRDLAALEVEVEITELDVIDWKLPADAATRDRAAASLVSAYLDAVASVRQPKAIVTWGLSDRHTWIDETFPRKDGAKARPLPLDVDYKPKPMMSVLNRYRRGAS